jgi:hypothetical protein
MDKLIEDKYAIIPIEVLKEVLDPLTLRSLSQYSLEKTDENFIKQYVVRYPTEKEILNYMESHKNNKVILFFWLPDYDSRNGIYHHYRYSALFNIMSSGHIIRPNAIEYSYEKTYAFESSENVKQVPRNIFTREESRSLYTLASGSVYDNRKYKKESDEPEVVRVDIVSLWNIINEFPLVKSLKERGKEVLVTYYIKKLLLDTLDNTIKDAVDCLQILEELKYNCIAADLKIANDFKLSIFSNVQMTENKIIDFCSFYITKLKNALVNFINNL